MHHKLEQAIQLIDDKNAQDPNKEIVGNESFPKELLYSRRMTRQLLQFAPEASEELQIAARAQHICRWKIDRREYPMDKAGYFKWRNDLKKIHAGLTSEILEYLGYKKDFIDRVSFLIQKKKLKKDNDTQVLEDVVCLVFLQHYFDKFAAEHEEDKVVDIIKKTWKKMSPEGHKAALQLELPPRTYSLVKRALQ